MTAPTEAEIRAADAEYWEYIAGPRRVTGGGPVTVARAPEERRELLRLLDEARAERDELLAHEKQTHESLGAILGTDDALEVCAKRMRAERDGARDLAEQYQRQIAALEAAVRKATAEAVANRRDAFRQGFAAGFNASGEGWNAEYPFKNSGISPETDPSFIKARDAAIDAMKEPGRE